MASTFETLSSIGTAASDLFGGFSSAKGYKAQEASYMTARDIAYENARLAGESGELQEYVAGRKVMKAEGSREAATAGAGFELGGSNTYLQREAALQGHVTQAMIGLQTSINQNSYLEQANEAEGAAKAASNAATKSEAGGIFGALASVAKLFF
jgi:hypothetical protein